MDIPAINKIGENPFLVKPLEAVDASTRARRLQAVGGTENGYDPFGSISRINGELTPVVGDGHYNKRGYNKVTFDTMA